MEEGGEKKRHLMGRRGWELECRGQDGGQWAEGRDQLQSYKKDDLYLE